jgi:PEP-CTERM motif-containing protein
MKLDDTEFEAPGNGASESMTVLSESSLYSLSDQGTLVLVSGGTVSGGQSTTFSPISPAVPEPSTWAMMALGFVGLGFVGYRRARLRPASV